jgi:hypothetical protein
LRSFLLRKINRIEAFLTAGLTRDQPQLPFNCAMCDNVTAKSTCGVLHDAAQAVSLTRNQKKCRLNAQMKYIIPFLALGACTPATAPTPDNVLIDMGQIETESNGQCFAKDTAPAVIETVTLQEIELPELRDANGTVTRPATFRTITRQQIVRERAEIRFETVCPQNYSVDLVATLQRALTARGFYAGQISGTLDLQTGAAIQQFQRVSGLDTPLLALATARQLGLVAFSKESLVASQ